MATNGDGERFAESRRILDRVTREADSQGWALLGRTRAHLSAGDAEQGDWIELWGTRIGRIIGAVVTIALLAWAVSVLFAGA